MLREWNDKKIQYRRFLAATHAIDERLHNFVDERLDHMGFQKLMLDLEFDRPEVFDGIRLIVKRAEKPDFHSPQELRESAWEAARELFRSWSCAEGFVEPEPEVQPVTLHLKHEKALTGLPRPWRAMADALVKDHGAPGVKWMFGFDNRLLAVDVPTEAIFYLERHPLVDRVVIEPRAQIMSNEIPAYNPSAVNTDWGVAAVLPTNAWNKGLKGENVKVAVLDTGIKAAHQAFWLSGETNYKGGWNFVGNNNNPADDHDHGTFCCGVLAHRHTGLAGHYRGIAPNVDLYAVKVLDSKGSGSFTNIAAALDWCRTNGMHIVSMSLGAASGSSTLQQACDAAWYAGLVLVAAAGNSGPGDNTIAYPARYASVISVPATNYEEGIADFSARGGENEIAGPGVYITGPWAGFTYKDYVVAGSNDKYMCASGTSAACPHVAACVALMLQWYPAATNMELREWLRTYAKDL